MSGGAFGRMLYSSQKKLKAAEPVNKIYFPKIAKGGPKYSIADITIRHRNEARYHSRNGGRMPRGPIPNIELTAWSDPYKSNVAWFNDTTANLAY